eukprot:SAG31_NODE_162_length_21892_cov_343.171936_11_plen_39_part_00
MARALSMEKETAFFCNSLSLRLVDCFSVILCVLVGHMH